MNCYHTVTNKSGKEIGTLNRLFPAYYHHGIKQPISNSYRPNNQHVIVIKRNQNFNLAALNFYLVQQWKKNFYIKE